MGLWADHAFGLADVLIGVGGKTQIS